MIAFEEKSVLLNLEREYRTTQRQTLLKNLWRIRQLREQLAKAESDDQQARASGRRGPLASGNADRTASSN